MTLFNTDAEATAAEIAPQVRTLQIIHATLMAGVAAYLVFIFASSAESVGDFRLW